MAVPGEASERARVLVVEDDESSALFVTRVLAREGFDSIWVGDADDAEARLEDEDFDVLLTDYKLPGRTGLDLVAQARRMAPDLGIAMMSSFNEDALEQSARFSGADDFIAKPLLSANLVQRITRLVQRSRAAKRAPGNTPVGGHSSEGPAATAPGVLSQDGTPGLPFSAGSGSGERPPNWGGEIASGDTDRRGEAGTHLRRGTGGASWARFPAFDDGYAAHPAGRGLRPWPGVMPRRGPAGHSSAGGGVPIWAFSAPPASFGSGTGAVGQPRTRSSSD